MSTDNDFVARLRIRWDAMGDMANDERAAAATEIERLRNERNAFEAERDELIRISNKLKRERDEARREVCALDADIMEDQMEYARHRGWDCYKEVKP